MLNKSSTRRKLTRKEQRDLDIEINFMEGVIRRDPKCIEAWRVLSDDYARRGQGPLFDRLKGHLVGDGGASDRQEWAAIERMREMIQNVE